MKHAPAQTTYGLNKETGSQNKRRDDQSLESAPEPSVSAERTHESTQSVRLSLSLCLSVCSVLSCVCLVCACLCVHGVACLFRWLCVCGAGALAPQGGSEPASDVGISNSLTPSSWTMPSSDVRGEAHVSAPLRCWNCIHPCQAWTATRIVNLRSASTPILSSS